MLFLLIVIAVVVFAWIRHTRANRQRWMARLHLPGLWVCDGEENSKEEKRTLELTGGLASGTYRSSDLGNGEWRLSGHTLLLRGDATEELALDLTVHDVGKISLERKSGERRVYNKRSGNVVPLLRRQT